MVRISVLSPVLFMTGCVSTGSLSTLANSPVVIDQLKIRSAGFTGCATEENEISNVNPRPDGSFPKITDWIHGFRRGQDR